jgi:transmembrane sensor
MPELDKIPDLIAKYLKDELSEVDQQELRAWIGENDRNKQYFEKATNEQYLLSLMADFQKTADLEAGIRTLVKSRAGRGKVVQANISSWKSYVTAAAVLILLVFGVYFWRYNKDNETAIAKASTPKVKNDLVPGGYKATLMLGNGQIVVLDSAGNGNLAQQGGTKVVKLGAGALSYNPSKEGDAQIYYNTINVPRGGQYQIILPDGTRVWINSFSTLHFPTTFTGKERKVELSGEAYFEVEKNAAMPFVVQLKNDRKIQVLGTHFDIMDYDDESEAKTTLVEGVVRVSQGAKAITLKPGQQAQIPNTGEGKESIKIVIDADVEEALAWKNGYFNFKRASIETIMRQISRWYDVSIEYKEPVMKRFFVDISRSSNVSAVFEALQATGDVHFQIEGKKIIVSH